MAASIWPSLIVIFCFSTLIQSSPFFPATNRDAPGPDRGGGGDSVRVSLTRNPNYAPNGPAVYYRALKKWGMTVPGQFAGHAAQKDYGDGEVSAKNQPDDKEYLSSVGIGTPLQWVNMDFDSGSSDFWVWSPNTAGGAVGNRSIYNPGASSTAQLVPNTTWHIMYGDGSEAYGNVYNDTVSIANISIPGSMIENAQFVSMSLAQDQVLSGVAGLAYNLSSEVYPSKPTLLQSLAPLLSKNLFTVDLKWHDAGEYNFGRIDDTRIAGNDYIHYTPLLDDASFWQFNFTGFNVGGDNKWYISSWEAIADTGTTLLLLDDGICKMYYAAVPGSVYNESLFTWTYPCNSTLPDFKVGFDNGWHATIPGKYMNFTVVDMSMPGWTCMGGLQSDQGQPFSILGDIFLKAVFAVFDIDNKRVGFSSKNLN
ncbi:acid protease [Diplogelasinospora grovesii]|uniref:Acid protease n=1 Tax=Diplogelasinospora grovesii TaxID=303347 RepID=A0AAN6N8H9_9PEZI|nr:acid protease [Diplogelasinospora grovesii]